MINRALLIMILISATYENTLATSQVFSTNSNKNSYFFDVRRPPATADWKYFHSIKASERSQIWNELTKTSDLAEWHWGWRLGWIRSCQKDLNRDPKSNFYCFKVLAQACFDEALVVRAEAVSSIGRLYANTDSPKVIDLLTESYRQSGKRKGNHHLSEAKRVLKALYNLGENGKKAGKDLAQTDDKTLSYWNKL